MIAEERSVSGGQAAMLILIGIATGGVYIWPGTAIRIAWQSAGWSAALAGPVVVGVLWLWHRLLGNTLETDLGAALAAAAGSWGRLLTLGYAILVIVYLAAVGALFGTLGNEVLAPRTSPLAFLGVAAGTGAWLATRPIRTLGRVAQLWAPIVSGLTVIVGLLGLQNLRWPGAILPAGAADTASVWDALLRSAYLWIPYPVLLTLVRRIRPRAERVPLSVWGAVWAQWLVLLWLHALVVGTVGTWPAVLLHWPTVFVYELIAVSTFLITQVGALVVVLWTVSFVAFWAINVWHVGVLVGGARGRAAAWAGTVLGAALGSLLIGFPHLSEEVLSSLSIAIAAWTALGLATLGLRAGLRWLVRRPVAAPR